MPNGLMDTILFERMFPGGQAATTYSIENYPGLWNPSVVLFMKLEEHARKFGLKFPTTMSIMYMLKALDRIDQDQFRVMEPVPRTGPQGRAIQAGVSYCATCDTFYKDRVTVVVGGDTALKTPISLPNMFKVYLIHRRDQFRGL